MADKIEIGPEGAPKVTFGVDTAHRPNPFTSPGRDYTYDGAGKLVAFSDRVSLTCVFIYEPDEVWDKFAEIKTQLENGILDFRYYRDDVIMLNLKTSDHVGSPRYENITPAGTPGELANHVKFTMDVIAEKGSYWGTWVLDVDRNLEVESRPTDEGGNIERRSITVRGEQVPSLSIIEGFVGRGELDQLESLKYSYQPDKNVWSASAVMKKESITGIDSFHETISVTGGGQESNFFQRTGSRLPLKMVGKVRPVVIVIMGEVRGPDLGKLRIPSRARVTGTRKGVKAKGGTNLRTSAKKLGKSGATEFDVSIVESKPDGTPRTFAVKYRETYKRALKESEIFSTVKTDYQLSSIEAVLAGQTAMPILTFGIGANWTWGFHEGPADFYFGV